MTTHRHHSSSKLLIFSNPGEIDPRLITTLGVNVKATDSPIGYFGTGLKYALAVALRLGCKITIHSGLREFRFEARTEVIRGKEFSLIHMRDSADIPADVWRPLGFTTDLGRNWLPWMAFREFECNAADEGGSSELAWEAPEPTAGTTRVIISGPALVDEFYRKSTWQLQSTSPIVASPTIEIHRLGASPLSVFYRGIKVAELPKPGLFTYNILAHQQLTEDRTLHINYQLQKLVTDAVSHRCTDPTVIDQFLRPGRQTWESDLDFDWAYAGNVSELFAKTVWQSWISFPATTNCLAVSLARKSPHGGIFEQEHEEAELTKVEAATMTRAIEFLRRQLAIKLVHPVKVVEQLGQYEILGLAANNTIWISRATIQRGIKVLAGTLLEEHLHLSHQLQDESRSMQNWLIDKLISIGEELKGEPL